MSASLRSKQEIVGGDVADFDAHQQERVAIEVADDDALIGLTDVEVIDRGHVGAAPEVQHVLAILKANNSIIAKTGCEVELISASAAHKDIVAAVAGDRVIALAAHEAIVSGVAKEAVSSTTALDDVPSGSSLDAVVAAAAMKEIVSGAAQLSLGT